MTVGIDRHLDIILTCKRYHFVSQIIKRNVAEPSLCKNTIHCSRCLRALLADKQKRWNIPEIEVPTVAYPPQYCHSSPLIGSLLRNCFDNRNAGTFMSKLYSGKITGTCDFFVKTRLFTKIIVFA